MANNITGITFTNQLVTAKDDGRLQHYLLSDGILVGCIMSYSAKTFTLGAGYMVVCGRLFRFPSDLLITVDQATSGFARIIVTIDLTAASTEEVFEQVAISVEYATTVNGFSSLTKNDVNGAGSKYQAVIAVVTLNASGIKSISSKMQSAAIRIGSGAITLDMLASDITPAALGAASLGPNGKVIPSQISAAFIQITESTTLKLEHEGGYVWATNPSTPIVITIPNNDSVAFPLRTEIEVIRGGSAPVSFAAESGVTIVSVDKAKSIAAQYGAAVLKKINTNVWHIGGLLE